MTTLKNGTVKITYAEMAEELINILQGEEQQIDNELLINKLQDLKATQERKAEKAKSNPKTPKGASEKTLENGKIVKALLTNEFLTGAEIIEKGNLDFSVLQVATYLKYQDGIEKGKKVVTVTNSKGLKAEKEQTAYKLAD